MNTGTKNISASQTGVRFSPQKKVYNPIANDYY